MTKCYRYTIADLDNVYLMNGFLIDKDDDGDDTVAIEAIGDMNARLQQVLLVQTPHLDGAQMHWLRTEMGLDQSTLAGLLGVSQRIVASHESRRSVSLPSEFDDRFRQFACEQLGYQAYTGSWVLGSDSYAPYCVRLSVVDGRWCGHVEA